MRTTLQRLVVVVVVATVVGAGASCGDLEVGGGRVAEGADDGEIRPPPGGAIDDGRGDGGADDAADPPGDEGRLIGVWRGASVDLVGNPVVVEVVLQESGAFSQTETGPIGVFYQTGDWRIIGPGLVRLNIAEYYPEEFCGPRGCTPIRILPSYTVGYRFLGPDVLETSNADGGVLRLERVPL